MKLKPVASPSSIAVVPLLVIGLALPIPAYASGTASAKITAAKAEYAKTIVQAKADYVKAIRPSRNTAVEVGKKAEAARRLTVAAAFAVYSNVIAKEKASVLGLEKNYKAAVSSLAVNPTSATLKTNVKNALSALTSASVALQTDANIAAARSAFAQARSSAMAKFHSSVAVAVAERTRSRDRATLRFKDVKARALAKLQATIAANK